MTAVKVSTTEFDARCPACRSVQVFVVKTHRRVLVENEDDRTDHVTRWLRCAGCGHRWKERLRRSETRLYSGGRPPGAG
jgi:DNA-directed RNA polymerase subunit M/transcription elongation factor TFIIS